MSLNLSLNLHHLTCSFIELETSLDSELHVAFSHVGVVSTSKRAEGSAQRRCFSPTLRICCPRWTLHGRGRPQTLSASGPDSYRATSRSHTGVVTSSHPAVSVRPPFFLQPRTNGHADRPWPEGAKGSSDEEPCFNPDAAWDCHICLHWPLWHHPN